MKLIPLSITFIRVVMNKTKLLDPTLNIILCRYLYKLILKPVHGNDILTHVGLHIY